MDALTLLTTRQSTKKLQGPAPTKAQIEEMIKAAMHVPDHGRLQPYRFVLIPQEKISAFGQTLKQGALELNLAEIFQTKADKLTAHTPLIIAVIGHYMLNLDKVPQWEQLASASCAAFAIQLAANAQGFDNVWLSGKWTESNAVRSMLNCEENEQIVALIALGKGVEASAPKERKKSLQDLVSSL